MISSVFVKTDERVVYVFRSNGDALSLSVSEKAGSSTHDFPGFKGPKCLAANCD